MSHNEIKVSIIIPAYNVGKYLYRALESSISQTHKNVEIIVVNDGSLDNTQEVIDSYCKIDNRIVSIFQENKGVSSARNIALNSVKGEYVLFLDSDDWLEKDCVEVLLNEQLKHKNCLIASNCFFANLDEKGNIIKEEAVSNNEKKIYAKESAMLEFESGKLKLCSSCYKIFSTKVIRENEISFNSQIYHGEDGLFVFKYLYFCEGLVSIENPLWNILERPNSATTGGYNRKWLTAIDAVEEMLNIKNISKKVKKKLNSYMVSRALTIESEALKSDSSEDDDIKYIRRIIRQYHYSYYLDHKVSKDSLYCLALTIIPIKILRIRYKNKIEK